jgi:hypothetical protein
LKLLEPAAGAQPVSREKTLANFSAIVGQH